MKQNSLFIIIASILLVAVTSCGGNSNSSDAEQVDKALSKAKTAEAARNISGRQLLSETPDTVFLDYYWGMSKKDADALTKKYISEKKMYRDDFVRETIHYNMAINEIGLVPTTFGCFYYKDSLAQIIFMADIYSKSVEVLDFVSTFSNHYLDKGYVVISEASDPVFHEPSINFYKGNTSVSFFEYQKMYRVMCLKNEYYCRKMREEAEEKRANEEMAKKSAMQEEVEKSRRDF